FWGVCHLFSLVSGARDGLLFLFMRTRSGRELISNNKPSNSNNLSSMARNGEEEVNNPQRNLLRDLAQPVIGSVTSCIRLGPATRNYELKTIHDNQLPSFHGLFNEDPLHFIRDFYNVLQTFPLHGLNEDQLKMRCFPETLNDRAKAWFMTLAPDSLTTWKQVYSKFFRRYYSHQKTQELWSQIFSFAQQPNEPLHEAWEKFKDLQRQCPHHNFPPALLMNSFYDSLHQNLQYMVDNAAGGDIGAKTAEEMMEIFEMMSANSSQKSSRGKKARNLFPGRFPAPLIHDPARHFLIRPGFWLESVGNASPAHSWLTRISTDVIQNMSSYVKFFKDLVTKKRQFEDGEKIVVYEAASTMHHDLSKKERDTRGFVIKIALGNGKEASGMLDLGAGINLFPFSIFQRLGLGDLRPTRMCLQLANSSIRYPKEVVEDVLIRVGKLIVHVYFVILNVGEVHENGKDHSILLGRPFITTTNTLIDVKNGTLNMTVLGKSVYISIWEATSASSVNFMEECAFIDVTGPFVEDTTIR
ncbi:Unknown protein, partial [Striga hermonthica]